MEDNKISLILSVDISFDKISKLNSKNNEDNLKNLNYLSEISKIIHQIFSDLCKPKISWMVSDNKDVIEKWSKIKESFLAISMK